MSTICFLLMGTNGVLLMGTKGFLLMGNKGASTHGDYRDKIIWVKKLLNKFG